MVKNKYVNFALSNIRHSPGSIVAIALLIIIASALLNTALFLSVDYKQSFMREKERLSGEDIDLLFAETSYGTNQKDDLADILSENSAIRQFEIDECYSGRGTVDYGDTSVFNSISLLRYEDAKKKQIGKYEILESDGGSGVYLGYVFKVGAGYSIGDTVTVTIGSQSRTFRIAGFYNNIDTGTVNCSDTALLLTDDCYDDIENFGAPSYRVSIRLRDMGKADSIESVVNEDVSSSLPTLLLVASSSIRKLSTARYVTTTIFKAIIVVSAIVIIAVLLTIIAITLSNYIRSSIKNLGILKAVGYTSNILIVSVVCEFMVISLIMSVVGVAGSYLLFPAINNAMEQQVGIPYHIHFLPGEAVLAVAVCTGIVIITAFFSVLKIRRILPINAIREYRTKVNKTSLFSLDMSRFGINTSIALKNWISGKARNAVIFIFISIVAFSVGFACALYQNVVVNGDDVLKLVCGQMTDSVIGVDASHEQSLKDELSDNEDVDRYYMFTINAVAPAGMSKMSAYVIESAEYIDAQRVCIDGRLPSTDHEIAINGAYAKQNGLKTGDTVTFKQDDEDVRFTVTGIIQGAYSSGRDCFLTRDGYTRFAALKDIRYYVDLKDGVDIDTFNSSIGETCDVMYSINYRKSVDVIAGSYITILKLTTVIVMVLSFMITGFILYVLLNVLLSSKKREFAIYKALGFTTGDIIYQTVASILPTSVIATAAGLWISRRGATSLFTLALNGMGIFSFGNPTKSLYLVGSGIMLIIFIIVCTILLSDSVRNITPHKLFTNE